MRNRSVILRLLAFLTIFPLIFFLVDYLNGTGPRPKWQYYLIGAILFGVVIYYVVTVGRRQRILNNGIRGRAKILAVEDTGVQVNFKPQLRIKLLVSIPSTPPYEVNHLASVDYYNITRLEIGGEVTVMVDRRNQNTLIIKWSENL